MNRDDCLLVLEQSRHQCAVLRQLLIPDNIWEQYRNFELSPRDNALHASIVIVSMMNGDLNMLTSPCHRYLFDGDDLKAMVTKQYRQDLQEKWMFQVTEIERQHKSKIFQGRIVELQIAEWLENHRWQIVNLEALGGSFDIEGHQPGSGHAVIEVKFIGQSDEEFGQLVNALHYLPAGGSVPTPTASNYLIFRIYEASSKLMGSTDRRIALVVVNGLAWTFFKIALRDRCIDWKQPRFLEAGKEWDAFLQKQKIRYPNIDADLASSINSLDELLIMEQRNGYQYSTEFQYRFQ